MTISIPQPDPFDQTRRTGVIRSYVSYASQDFDSIRERLFQYARDNYGAEYNDYASSSYGAMIIGLMAHGLDMSSFKIDMLLNESFLVTAQLRNSVALLARSLGYFPRGTTSAAAPFSVSVPASYETDLIIEPGTPIELTDPQGSLLRFELYARGESGDVDENNPIVISAGQTKNSNVIGIEGTTVLERLISTGEPSQRFRMNDDELVESWIRVKANGISWKRVDFLNGLDYQYTLTQDFSGAWVIHFGDGTDGIIPPQGTEIDISYRRGGGNRGNIIANFFNEVINVASGGSSAPVSITNYESGSGGADAETIDEIRKNAVLLYKAQDRAVTTIDYEVLTERYFSLSGTGDVKAKAVLRHAGCSANVIDIYTIKTSSANDLEPLTDDEKEKALSWLRERAMVTDVPVLLDAAVVSFDVTILIRTLKAFNRGLADTEDRVRTRLDTFFSLANWSIGQSVSRASIIKALSTVPDVLFLDAYMQPASGKKLNTVGDLDINFWEIARPKNVHIRINFED